MKEPVEMPLYLIRQGRLVYDNLMKIGKSEPWVRETLAQLQIYDVRDVRYALLDQFGHVHILHA
ncbi:MAG TPA: YetF domain-containing protein [Bacilli bacterium]|nr:YetF domain-containing protein [Bacilli bacterium]